MKHRNSHLLVGYWSRLRKGAAVPDQTDIDPRAIKRVLPYVFILDAADPERPLYRLAGTSHCDRYGSELKGTGFLSRWESQSRSALLGVLQQSLTIRQPICLSSLVASDACGMVEVETILAPLSFGAAVPSRFLGISQMLGDQTAINGKPIVVERLVSSRFVQEVTDAASGAPPAPPAAPPRAPDRAPHLRLVVSRPDAPVRPRVDPMMQQLMDALEIHPLASVRAVS